MSLASGLPTGTVEETEVRNSGDEALVLEGDVPRQRKRSVMVLETGLWMSMGGVGV
jgi:hypothetical protein